MAELSNHEFEIVWKKQDNDVQTSIKSLWSQNGAIVKQDVANQRVKEAVMVVRYKNEVVGVSTARKILVPLFDNNYFYDFRCFIDPDHRVAGLDVKLSVETFKCLEEAALKDTNPCIGIFATLENKKLQEEKVWRRAVWPEIEMVFAGYTTAGYPIRVKYFKGARI